MNTAGGILLCGDGGVGYGDFAVAVAEDACTAFCIGSDGAAGQCQAAVGGKCRGTGSVKAGVIASGAVGGIAVHRKIF